MFVSCPPPNPARHLVESLRQARIIPDVLNCEPQAVIQVLYPCDIVVEPGITISVDEAVKEPIIRWKSDASKLYTFVMIDLDMPKAKGHYLLWLVGNIPGCDVVRGERIVAYMDKRSSEGKELHRSLFLAYRQYLELDFDEPYLTAADTEGRAHFDVNGFAKKYALGSPIAANFFVAKWEWAWNWTAD
ncbi:putative odorant-binding protein A5 [Drosophila pseudoobscura]|uniref:Odorant-binding protein A5 n=1 Tax=Drosophila pseudoobscura pseudoobscura TaxID=46245 RepID=A0A6I8VU79_DROPS|nr:putative odorant-binding protein A5 [Drosophila pseudoobscura]